MTLSEVLLALQDGKAARRTGWHSGIHYIYLDTNQGVPEPFICQTGTGGTMNWPLFLRRGDWCANDWAIINPDDFPKPNTGQALVQQTMNGQAEIADQLQPQARQAPRKHKAKPKASARSAGAPKSPRRGRAPSK